MKSSRVFIAAIVAAAAWAGVASTGAACSVPVFRYALELWPPDDFPLLLFHRGTLGEEDRALIGRLQAATKAEGANLRLEAFDVESDLEPGPMSVWEAVEDRDLDRPLLVLRVPARTGLAATVLTLELSPENVGQLIDSPVRKEIGRRLLEDHSVVWVLLESGDADRDDRAFGALNTEIIRLEGSLEMPQPDAADLLSADAEPLKLIFSSIRVARDDPEERAFVAMLLNVEPDLNDPEFEGDPMVFPVFGRGRALYALVGDGIVPSTIEDAARYLTGACQCTVKAENPGADLLMAVDWERFVVPTIEQDATPPTLGGLASFAEPDADAEEPADASAASATRPEADAADAVRSPDLGTIGPLAGESSASEKTEAVAAGRSPTSSESGGGPRLGLNALLIVGVMGVVVVLAGVALTRRDA